MVTDVSEEPAASKFFSDVDGGNTVLRNTGKDVPTRLQGAIHPSQMEIYCKMDEIKKNSKER
jgi:hypothetical protein